MREIRYIMVAFLAVFVIGTGCAAQLTLQASSSGDIKPTILRTGPTNGESNVPTNTSSMTVSVSGAVDDSDCDATLTCGSTEISLVNPSFNESNLSCVWSIGTALPASSSCTGSLDISGTSSSFNFSTAAGADSTAPTIDSSTPSNGATGVATNLASVILAFSERMDSTTCTTSNLSSSPSITFASCSVSSDGKSFTWGISGALSASTTYTLTTSTSLLDASGNTLASVNRTFTTAAASDSTAPTISTSTPSNGATDVATNLTGLSIAFTEAMDTSQCKASTLSTSPSLTISGCTASSDSRTFTWAISGGLSASTTYTVTTSSSLTDSAGNALVSTSRSFTTAAAADSTSPTISIRTPASGATTVLICQPIYICFSETISSDQCKTANASYTPDAFPPAPAGFSYCCVTGTAGCTTPKDPNCSGTEFEWGLDWPTVCGLTARSGGGQTWNTNTAYTVTISNVADPSGNTMTSSSFSFTTGNN